ncbi:MAG TPA: cytochrome c [Candidatus Acidoferrum sp.]|nr:cytochrome c [Candidatus Acidoferrum sp.]
MKRMGFIGLILFAAFAVTAWPQAQTEGTSQKKTVEKVPIKQTSAAAGQEMYVAYCAACHGKDGKGDGPAASELKQPPPDLTVLAKNNNGKFPADHVANVLRFGVETPAHGSKDMPTWGHLLSSLHGRITANDPMVQLRIANLTKYIESLQSK